MFNSLQFLVFRGAKVNFTPPKAPPFSKFGLPHRYIRQYTRSFKASFSLLVFNLATHLCAAEIFLVIKVSTSAANGQIGNKTHLWREVIPQKFLQSHLGSGIFHSIPLKIALKIISVRVRIWLPSLASSNLVNTNNDLVSTANTSITDFAELPPLNKFPTVGTFDSSCWEHPNCNTFSNG